MPTTKTRSAPQGGKKGNFADQRDELLTMFADPDEPGERKWRQSFGQRPEKPKRGRLFTAPGTRRSL